MNGYLEYNQLIVDHRQRRNLNYFWVGFIIYTSVFAVTAAFSRNYSICQVLQLLSLFLLIPAAFSLMRNKIETTYLKILIFCYWVWSLVVIVRGFSFDQMFVKDMIFNADFGIWPYLVPAVVLFPQNLVFYKKLFNVIVILGAFYLLFDIVFIRLLMNPDHTDPVAQGSIESFSKYLSLPMGFILMTFPYHSRQRRLFALAILMLTLFFAIYRARRGLIGMAVGMMVFAFILYLSASRAKLLIILVTVIAAFFIVGYLNEVINHPQNSVFSFLVERGDEDTRTQVEKYFYQDMQPADWVAGKGIRGEYFCPVVSDDDISGYRSIIETDYLNIILKGGIVRLALLLLITIPAIFLGLFRSNNLLSKAAGVWIFLWALSLYPANVTTFTLNYVLVWICVGVCYSKFIRQIPEKEMTEYFRAVFGQGPSPGTHHAF